MSTLRRVGPVLLASATGLWLAFHTFAHVVLNTLGVPCL